MSRTSSGSRSSLCEDDISEQWCPTCEFCYVCVYVVVWLETHLFSLLSILLSRRALHHVKSYRILCTCVKLKSTFNCIYAYVKWLLYTHFSNFILYR